MIMYGETFKKRVAVLRGGLSSEYDVSLMTGAGVIAALVESPYITKDVVIARNGDWLVHGFPKTPEQALADVDCAFIALHGEYGEDGTVQRILERLHIPYTGSGSYASSVAMNKAATKEHLKKHAQSIHMAPHIKVSREGLHDVGALAHSISNLFGPEYVIKPNTGGSSIGTMMVGSEGLTGALKEILETFDSVIVEKRVRGREATVGILDGFRGQTHYRLPEVEIVPPPKTDYFSADVKYSGDTQEICPGRFSSVEKERLLEAAHTVHTVLGLRQYSRSDFIVADDGVYFLEVNTLPGLTSQSLFPKAVEAVGSTYRELVLHLLETARVY
jgi:D-alanine-D-alanine ligase